MESKSDSDPVSHPEAEKVRRSSSEIESESKTGTIEVGEQSECAPSSSRISETDNSPPPYTETDDRPKPTPRRHRKRRPTILDPNSSILQNPTTPTSSSVSQGQISPASTPVRIHDDEECNNDDAKEDDFEEEVSQPSKKYLSVEVHATIIAAFSFLCIGLQRAYTSPAIASMKNDYGFFNADNPMSNTVVSWVAAAPPLASFFGTIMSGVTLNYCGRQKTLVLLTGPYIVGWLLIAFAKNTTMIMVGRGLTGLAAGFSTAAAPMYVSECVRAKVRGFLGFVPAMMLSLGILLGFALSTINLDWQSLAMLMTCFPMLLFVFAISVPESPIWLLHRGKEEKAMESLRKLRGFEYATVVAKNTSENEVQVAPRISKSQQKLSQEIENELEEMKRVMRKRHSIAAISKAKRHSKGNAIEDPEVGGANNKNKTVHEKEPIVPETFMQFVFSDLLGKREIRFPAFVTASLMIFQQATGANAVIYYLSVILNEADPNLPNATFINSFGDEKHHTVPLHKDGLDPNVASVIFGFVQFFAFFLSLPLCDRLGRRALLMTSAALMILPHVVLGLYFWVKMYPNSLIHVYTYASIIKRTSSWLPLFCLCSFIAGYSVGFGPVPFIIMSEVFPSSVRSYMVALASLVNHLTLFLLVRVFPIFFDLLGPHVVFWSFAVLCFLALIYVAIFVPETKGFTLAQIEETLKKKNKGKSEDDKQCDCCNHK